MEAWAELDKIIGDSDEIAAPEALETFLAQYHALAGTQHTVEERSPIGVPEIADIAPSPRVTLDIAAVVSSAPAGVERSTSTGPPAAEDPLDAGVQSLTDLFSGSFPSAVVESAKPRSWTRTLGLAAVLVALASGGVFAGRRYLAPSPARAVSGTLAISTNPPGALVTVDGESRGVSPINLALDAGAHIVQLSGAGEPRSIPVTIVAGTQASQYVELGKGSPSLGQLEVRTDPAGARVTLDGVSRGTAPLTIGDLAPGAHAVTLEGDVGSAKHAVKIEAGVTAVLVAALTVPPSGPASGWIAVTAPFDMQLYENGRLLGNSETERIMVPAGKHDIEVVNIPLGYRVVRSVQVAPGKVLAMAVDLPKQRISLNAIPWAEVWIDGAKAGETPIGDLSVSIGPHEVLFRHPDLGEQRHAITVTATAPARLSVDMRKK
jgi:hypothetical protein